MFSVEPEGQQKDEVRTRVRKGSILFLIPFGGLLYLVPSVLTVIAYTLFLMPVFSQFMPLSEAKLLALGVPFSIFLLSPVSIVYDVRYVEGKPVASGISIGGTIIPAGVTAYLLWELRAWILYTLLVIGVAILVNWATSKPDPELGISVNTPVEVLLTVTPAAFLFADHYNLLPAVTFSASVIGTIVGGDVLHGKQLRSISKYDHVMGGGGILDGISKAGLYALALSYALITFHIHL